jgi:hypothetical protein
MTHTYMCTSWEGLAVMTHHTYESCLLSMSHDSSYVRVMSPIYESCQLERACRQSSKHIIERLLTCKIFQTDETKKAKKLESEAEAKNAEKEAAAAKVEELEKEMEALKESRATRETTQAVAAGSKVVLTPQQQSAFGACRHGRKEELTDLLTAGVVHVNCINEAGNSLLVIAAQNNQKDICKALHNRGADLDTPNRLGQTALHFAFAFGYTELGKWLVQKGANTNLKNANGMTCYQGLSPAQPAMPFVQRYVK